MFGKKLKVTALRRAYQTGLVGLTTNMPTKCVLFRASASSGFTITTLTRIPAQTGPSCLHQDGQEVSGKHTTTGFKPRSNQGAGRWSYANGRTPRHDDPRDSQHS